MPATSIPQPENEPAVIAPAWVKNTVELIDGQDDLVLEAEGCPLCEPKVVTSKGRMTPTHIGVDMAGMKTTNARALWNDKPMRYCLEVKKGEFAIVVPQPARFCECVPNAMIVKQRWSSSKFAFRLADE